jgi:hypothetical protein
MVKKIFLSSLAILFLLNTSGLELFFAVMQSEFKKDAEEIMEGFSSLKDFSIIKITNTDLRGIIFINDNEISYKMKRYDICKVKKTADTIYYYCYNDENEQNLIDIFIGTNKKMGNGKSCLIKAPEKIYICPVKLKSPVLNECIYASLFLSNKYPEPIIKVNPQPPQKNSSC